MFYNSINRYDSDLELEHESPPAGAAANDNQLPLIPTDFSSITEAIQNFTAVFESRYSMNENFEIEGLIKTRIFGEGKALFERIMENQTPAVALHFILLSYTILLSQFLTSKRSHPYQIRSSTRTIL